MAARDADAAFRPIIKLVDQGVVGFVEVQGSVLKTLLVGFTSTNSESTKRKCKSNDRYGHRRFPNGKETMFDDCKVIMRLHRQDVLGLQLSEVIDLLDVLIRQFLDFFLQEF